VEFRFSSSRCYFEQVRNVSMLSRRSLPNATVCTFHTRYIIGFDSYLKYVIFLTTVSTALLSRFSAFYATEWPLSSSLLMGVLHLLRSLAGCSALLTPTNHVKKLPSQITVDHRILTSFAAYGLSARSSFTFFFWIMRLELRQILCAQSLKQIVLKGVCLVGMRHTTLQIRP